jgi:hypothetical protein
MPQIDDPVFDRTLIWQAPVERIQAGFRIRVAWLGKSQFPFMVIYQKESYAAAKLLSYFLRK